MKIEYLAPVEMTTHQLIQHILDRHSRNVIHALHVDTIFKPGLVWEQPNARYSTRVEATVEFD